MLVERVVVVEGKGNERERGNGLEERLSCGQGESGRVWERKGVKGERKGVKGRRGKRSLRKVGEKKHYVQYVIIYHRLFLYV